MLVEVDYLIHRSLDPGVLISLLADVKSGAYRLVKLTAADHGRIAEQVSSRSGRSARFGTPYEAGRSSPRW